MRFPIDCTVLSSCHIFCVCASCFFLQHRCTYSYSSLSCQAPAGRWVHNKAAARPSPYPHLPITPRRRLSDGPGRSADSGENQERGDKVDGVETEAEKNNDIDVVESGQQFVVTGSLLDARRGGADEPLPGQFLQLSHVFGPEAVAAFATHAGDNNPIHLDQDYARRAG